MRQQLPEGYPANVAIILDGNGRWAKKRGLPRSLGHRQGCQTLEQIIRDANDLGLNILTVYGFSTENWKRSAEEVGALMNLFRYYMKRIIGIAIDGNVRIRMIGEKSRFAPDIIQGIDDMEAKTAHCDGMTLVIAINYGGRDELTRAARRMAEEAAKGELNPEEITEQTVAAHLDTAGLPDPDLMIRTSGELRLSNYLLWQLAYAEFYVTDVLWPDFDKDELVRACEAFKARDRRFGGVKK